MKNEVFALAMAEEMSVKDYERIHDAVLSLANDADGYGLFENITEEDVEKCKWIAAILEVLDDVPRSRVAHVFKYRNIEFDYVEFIEGE